MKTRKKNKNLNRLFFNVNRILFILFIFFLPTQLGKHFFLPFSYIYGVRIDYLAPTIYLLDIIIFLLAVINFKTVLNFFKKKIFLYLLPLFLINIFMAKSEPLALYKLARIVEFLIVFSLGQKMLTILKERVILIGLLITGFFQFLIVIFQIILRRSLGGIFYYFGERFFTLATPGIAKAAFTGKEFLRPYGTFSHPNSLSGFFLLLYIFVLTYKKFNKYVISKYFFLFISSCLVFISFSKVAIISYLILNILYLTVNKKSICKICNIAKLAIPIVLSFLFLSATTDPTTVEKRIELAGNSISIILKYPLFGVGLGNYLLAQSAFISKFPLFVNQPVHNIFLLMLAETGLVLGILIIFLLIIQFKKKQWLIILAIILTGLFDHYWLTLEQNFILLALVMSL